MGDASLKERQELNGKELKGLHEELYIVLPFFAASVYFFFGSLRS